EGLPLAAQEAQHRTERRHRDAGLPAFGGPEPVFVEIEAPGHDVRDPLVQAGHEQAADSGIMHGGGRTVLITLGPVPRYSEGAREAMAASGSDGYAHVHTHPVDGRRP